MYSDNPTYVDGRLRQTIIRLNTGVPVYCEGAREGDRGVILWYKTVSVSNFGPLETKRIENFDLTSPPLGYTNYEGDSYYVARYPMRRDWRQGVRESNLALVYKGRTKRYALPSLNPLIIPILKMYPTYRETVDRVEDIYTNCAFTRSFSLDDRGRLWYKGREVVGEDKGGDTPQLFDNFFWLNELLTEEIQDRAIAA